MGEIEGEGERRGKRGEVARGGMRGEGKGEIGGERSEGSGEEEEEEEGEGEGEGEVVRGEEGEGGGEEGGEGPERERKTSGSPVNFWKGVSVVQFPEVGWGKKESRGRWGGGVGQQYKN